MPQMKSLIISILIICLVNITVAAQSSQDFIGRFNSTVSQIPGNINSEEGCDDVINEFSDIQSDINSVLENEGDIPSDEVRMLKATRQDAETGEKFVRTVGNSSYPANFMSEKQLSRMQELLDFDIFEVLNNKFCIRIYEIRIEKYVSILAYKQGNKESFDLEIQLKFDGGSGKSTITMGLISNKYRKFWNNGDKPSYRNYSIVAVKCTSNGTNPFID